MSKKPNCKWQYKIIFRRKFCYDLKEFKKQFKNITVRMNSWVN